MAEEEILGHLAPQHVRQKGQVQGIIKTRENEDWWVGFEKREVWFESQNVLIFFQTWGLSISQLVDLAKRNLCGWCCRCFLCVYMYTHTFWYGFLSIPWWKSFNTLQAVYWDGIDYFRSSFACRESYHRICMPWVEQGGWWYWTKPNCWHGKSMMKYMIKFPQRIYCTLYT